jgi:hypothetical protein
VSKIRDNHLVRDGAKIAEHQDSDDENGFAEHKKINSKLKYVPEFIAA